MTIMNTALYRLLSYIRTNIRMEVNDNFLSVVLKTLDLI